MKSTTRKKGDRVTKGAPSGIAASFIFHGIAFAVAGLLVVITTQSKDPIIFVQPQVNTRPEMDLVKPQVKIRATSKPQSASRIVAPMRTAKVPEISLPDLVGSGDALWNGKGDGDSGVAFFDSAQITPFGVKNDLTTGRDLEVTFYCLARSENGQKNAMSHQAYFSKIASFVKDGWDRNLLNRYYHSPEKMYARCIAIPIVSSIIGPLSFGENDYVGNARCWVAHYRGVITHKEGITFRFWGASDDVLTVAIDKEVVLAANFPWDGVDAHLIAPEFDTTRAPGSRSSQLENDGIYRVGNSRADVSLVGSDWITLEPGEQYDFDAVVGEGPGGEFFALLMVEVAGEEYEKNDRGSPMFPLFAMEPLSWEMEDSILMDLSEGDACVTNITTYFVYE